MTFKIGDKVERIPCQDESDVWKRFTGENGDRPLVVTLVDYLGNWIVVNGYAECFIANQFKLVTSATQSLVKGRKRSKQKPPVRQKSDITVNYENGKFYTLRNISALCVQRGVFQVTRQEPGSPGVSVTKTFSLSGVVGATLKTPNGDISISALYGSILVDTRHHSFSADYYFWEA